MGFRFILFAYVEEPLGTGLAQGARDDEARRLIMQAWYFFRAYDIFFLQILRHQYNNRKTIKN